MRALMGVSGRRTEWENAGEERFQFHPSTMTATGSTRRRRSSGGKGCADVVVGGNLGRGTTNIVHDSRVGPSSEKESNNSQAS